MPEPVITLRGSSKSYGKVQALRGLTLELPGGPVGLLGPNGAGKTTLIKLLLGLLEPDAGTARILGFDPTLPSERIELRRRLGYMPEGDCLPTGMTAVELLTALGRMTGLSAADAMTRTHEALDYVGLEEARYRDMSEYSTGMKQRVKLAQALAHDPPLLLLDEPTNGLDPKGRRHMLELVHDLGHAQGKHLILCSHLLPDVERTCDYIVVLDRGRAAASGTIAELTRGDGLAVRVRVTGGVGAFEAALAGRGVAVEREQAEALRTELVPATEAADFRVGMPGEDSDELFALAHASGARIESIEDVRSTLDQVFMRILRDAQESGA